MKQSKHLLLALLTATTSLSTNAADFDFTVNGIYYNYISKTDKTVEVTSGTEKTNNSTSKVFYSGDITIPSTVKYSGKTYTVISIGERAFDTNTGLTSVEIPNTVTSIGEDAFFQCIRLTSIDIPNSVTSIGSAAFYDCANLTSVEIPNSVTTIGKCAFGGWSKLREFTGKFASEDHRCLIVNGILNSFAQNGLTTYTIPNSVTRIGEEAFSKCSSLKSVVIPRSVTGIEYCAFVKCTNIKEITSFNTTPPSASSGAFYSLSTSECVIKVPASAVNAYKAANEWKNFENIVALQPAEINLTVSAAEYATLTLPFDANIPDGLQAYTCDEIRGGALVLRQANKLEAYTPYIIYGYNVAEAGQDDEVLIREERSNAPSVGFVAKTYTFTGYATQTTGQYAAGELIGTLEDMYAPTGFYVLQQQSGVVGFYRVAADNSVLVKANRCCLREQSSQIRSFTFIFENDDETGINPVCRHATKSNTPTYTLSGARAVGKTKGIVVKDGRKMLVK